MITVKSKPAKKEIITARCDTTAKNILNLMSQSEDASRSEIITKSILEYHARHFLAKPSFETEKAFFGRYGSHKGDISIRGKHYLKEILREKHGHS